MYKLGHNVQAISHLLFVDDMLMFTIGNIRLLNQLKGLLKHYEETSHQINLRKSGFYPTKYIQYRKLHHIIRSTGCTVKESPFIYHVFRAFGQESYSEIEHMENQIYVIR